jgi:hypothetical protein
MNAMDRPQPSLQHQDGALDRGSALLGVVGALALVSLLALGGVAIHELQYASHHPYAYGPAKVIALGAGAGATLAAALMLLAVDLLRHAR